MALRIFNSLSRKKEDFTPLVAGEARIYVCGVTVYDLCHIGHARSAIVFDVVHRYLRFKGLRVTFVKNFTDVDDKIIKRANDEGVPATGVSERYIAEYRADMASIGVLPPDVEPKATEHIPEMVALIERLIANGVAYVVDGDVYFEVRRFPAYGALSGKNIDDLEAGARVDVDERKRDPLDFALWKAAKPGEPSWPSPWGPGRPGWHIECSAMAMRYLGESFDLHGGGEDLIFPHHENEIAQSEAATARPFVRYWLHNGFVNLGSEKMSKSLGNTLTIRDMVRRHDPEAIRLYLLGTHYRHPLEFSDERIAEAARALGRLSALKAEAERIAAKGSPPPGADGGLFDEVAAQRARFEAAMDDDFNTPQALGVLFDLARVLNTARDQVTHGAAGAGAFLLGVAELSTLAGVLGLLRGRRPASGRRSMPQLKARVESLVNLRQEARKQRDFAEADRLRDELTGWASSWRTRPAGPPGSSGEGAGPAAHRPASRARAAAGGQPARRGDRHHRRRAGAGAPGAPDPGQESRGQDLVPEPRAAHVDGRDSPSPGRGCASRRGELLDVRRPPGRSGGARGAGVLPGARPGAGSEKSRRDPALRGGHRGAWRRRAQAQLGGV